MKILYLEDDIPTGRPTTLLLTKLGHEVDYAMSADEAITFFMANSPYALIITDIDMRGHGGPYFAQTARMQGYDGRIIVLTNYERERCAEIVRRLGAEYQQKPVTQERLKQIVQGKNDYRTT